MSYMVNKQIFEARKLSILSHFLKMKNIGVGPMAWHCIKPESKLKSFVVKMLVA